MTGSGGFRVQKRSVVDEGAALKGHQVQPSVATMATMDPPLTTDNKSLVTMQNTMNTMQGDSSIMKAKGKNSEVQSLLQAEGSDERFGGSYNTTVVSKIHDRD
jgi:hypothetical protein